MTPLRELPKQRRVSLRGGREICALFVAFLVLLIAQAPSAHADSRDTITVSAAMSLKNAFEEIGTLFESKSAKARVLFNFGASGDLARQIEGGAPVDIFAAAAPKDIDDLEKKALLVPDTRKTFAANSLVLIVPTVAKTAVRSFPDLASPAVKRLGVVNPMTSPAGRYAEEILHHYRLSEAVRNKLVFGETVRQILDYVARGEIDAGIVYATDVLIRTKEVKVVVKAPEGSHTPVVYPLAVVKGTRSEEAAKAFISLVTSAEGQRILGKHGFKVDNGILK